MDKKMPKGRPTTLKERNNVECPECGSILTRSRGGGRSSGDHRLRRRMCEDCGQLFATVEVPVLYNDGEIVPFAAICPKFREQQRLEQRKRVGYHGTAAGRRPYERAADLKVHVIAIRPKRVEESGPWEYEDSGVDSTQHIA